MNRALAVVAGSILVALAPWPAHASDSRPSADRYRSPLIDLRDFHVSTVTTMFPEAEAGRVRPRIKLTIHNKSKRTLWIVTELTPPTKVEPTKDRGLLEPGTDMEFESTQDTLLAEAVYLLDLYLSSDETMKDSLEVAHLAIRFDASFVRDVETKLAVRRKEAATAAATRSDSQETKTFQGVVMKEKPTGFSRFAPLGSGGILTVSQDSIIYVHPKKGMLRLARTQVLSTRNASMANWVIVEYAEGTQNKTAWFGMYFSPIHFAEMQLALGSVKTFGGPAPSIHSVRPDWADSLFNVVVCSADSEQFEPAVAEDGAGGALVTWCDRRGGGFDLYLQHLLPSGAVDPAWPVDGRLLGGGRSGCATADGSGGAIVAFVRGSGKDGVFAQHVLPSGAIDPAWPVEGRRLCGAIGEKRQLTIVGDRAAGAVVVWMDARQDTESNFNYLYAQRVLASGTVDPSWPVDGQVLFPPPAPGEPLPWRIYHEDEFVAVPDGAGGVVVAWVRAKPRGHSDICAQRVLSSGVIAPGWPATGQLLCQAKLNQNEPRSVPDGAGGAIVSWEDGRGNKDMRLYIGHVMGNGAVDPAWPADGLAISPNRSAQEGHAMATDEAGGAIVVWRDSPDHTTSSASSGWGHLYVQHVTMSGILDPSWPKNGVDLMSGRDRQGFPRISSDGAGGAIVAWSEDLVPAARNDLEESTPVKVQHLTKRGVLDAAWPREGRILGFVDGRASLPQIIADGGGGAHLVFLRYRPGVDAKLDPRWFTWYDVYAQHVLANGKLQ